MAITSIRGTQDKLVKELYSRSDIQRNLRHLGFRAFLFGPNIRTLRQISSNQFSKFLKFLKVIRENIQDNFVVGKEELLPLTLPRSDELQKIDFDKLLNNKDAMQRVMRDCVFPRGRSAVDLRLLPWIYKSYIAL